VSINLSLEGIPRKFQHAWTQYHAIGTANGDPGTTLATLHPMIHFRQPELLLLALALPPLAWWWVARRRRAIRHPLAESLKNLPGGRAPLAFWGGLGLRLLALGALILAVAGPRWPDLRTRLQTEGIAIVMVTDVSGSMATRDFEWNGESLSRLDAVKKVFELFVRGNQTEGEGKLEGRPTDLIGLVVFGTLPETACPLTLSHSALLRALQEQKPRKVPGESETNIIDAVVWGLDRIRSGGPRRKVLIVLSDGEHNVPLPASSWRLQQAVQAAVALVVPIYTIDAGGSGISQGEPSQTAPTPEVRETAIRTLSQLAEGTGGQYFRADNSEALLQVYQAIDRKEREPIESYQYRRYHEGYPWLATASFVLFALVLILEMTLWRRLP
jgi:Ca-activated chloride channel family protein